MPRHSPCALSSLTASSQAPYRSPPRKREVSLAPLLLLFLTNPLSLGFVRIGDGITSLLRRSLRDSLVLLELCRQFTEDILSKLLPSSLRCSTIKTNYLLLPCLSLFSLFSFQGTTSTEAPYRSPRRKRHVSFTSLCLLFLAQTLRWFVLGQGFLALKPD